MQKKAKYIQLVGDALIPLLGFIFWHWGLFFIVLFYCLDIVVKECVLHLKSAKTNQFQQSKATRNWFISGSLSLLFLVISGFVLLAIMPLIDSNFHLVGQLKAFWSYKDMGIEQGYVLLPLVIFAGYTQYKMEFLHVRLYEHISIQQIWKHHLQAELIILAVLAIALALSQFIILPESPMVLLIILGSSGFQFWKLNKG